MYMLYNGMTRPHIRAHQHTHNCPLSLSTITNRCVFLKDIAQTDQACPGVADDDYYCMFGTAWVRNIVIYTFLLCE